MYKKQLYWRQQGFLDWYLDPKKIIKKLYYCARLCETFDNRLLPTFTGAARTTNNNALSIIINANYNLIAEFCTTTFVLQTFLFLTGFLLACKKNTLMKLFFSNSSQYCAKLFASIRESLLAQPSVLLLCQQAALLSRKENPDLFL